jgi:hypothetical protein
MQISKAGFRPEIPFDFLGSARNAVGLVGHARLFHAVPATEVSFPRLSYGHIRLATDRAERVHENSAEVSEQPSEAKLRRIYAIDCSDYLLSGR